MALFRDRQEYLETRKIFHDAEFINGELSQWGRRRRRNKVNKEMVASQLKLVTGTQNGDSVCKLAAAQSL